MAFDPYKPSIRMYAMIRRVSFHRPLYSTRVVRKERKQTLGTGAAANDVVSIVIADGLGQH